MKELNKEYYKGECGGCKHLRQMNQFSETWYCDLEHKHNDNGKSWRENHGKNMKRCNKYEEYSDKRCFDCIHAECNESYKHCMRCKLKGKYFHYSESACKNFGDDIETYNAKVEETKRKTRIDTLLNKRSMLVRELEKVDAELKELDYKSPLQEVMEEGKWRFAEKWEKGE